MPKAVWENPSVPERMDPETFSNFSEDTIFSRSPKNKAVEGFKNALSGIFATKDILPKDAGKDSIIKTTLRELLIYVAFVVIVSIISFGAMSPTMYYQTKILSELFLDKQFSDGSGRSFRTASQMDHFWKFTDDVLIPGLYWDKWYNNQTSKTETSVLYENYLVTSPHLRMLKVRNDSCEVHKDFRRAIHSCYNSYADYLEDRSEIRNETGFAWQEIKSFAKNPMWGQISTYSGEGGYIVDLGLSKEAAMEKIAHLKKNLWVDRGTRVVFADFTTYNPNINLFVVTKLITEFPATGGVVTSWQFRTLSLLETGKAATIAFVCFTIFIVFVVYYTIEELLEILTLGTTQYLKSSFWNWLDILTIILSGFLVFFRFYRSYVVNKIFYGDESKSAELVEGQSATSYTDRMETYQFDTLGFWAQQFNNVLALLTFIVWVKIFKYISFNKTMSQLSSTLSRCSKDIAGFGVMFFIVFFAFAQLGYLLFGTQVKDYSSFGTAVFTLLRLILGDFNFYDLEAANRVLGPIFFLSYIFFVFFVLMNMFLAIINDTYAEVKSELADSEDDFAIMDYFKSHYHGLLGKLGKHQDQIEGIQAALKADSEKVSYENVRKELKKRNLTDQEIELLFAKYDVDNNRELDKRELERLFEDLTGKKRMLESQIQKEQSNRPVSAVSLTGPTVTMRPGGGTGVPPEEMAKIVRRIDRMEYTLTVIVNKIDSVLDGRLILPKNDKKEDENKNTPLI